MVKNQSKNRTPKNETDHIAVHKRAPGKLVAQLVFELGLKFLVVLLLFLVFFPPHAVWVAVSFAHTVSVAVFFAHAVSVTVSTTHAPSVAVSITHALSEAVSITHAGSVAVSFTHAGSVTVGITHAASVTVSITHAISMTVSITHAISKTVSIMTVSITNAISMTVSITHAITMTLNIAHAISMAVPSTHTISMTHMTFRRILTNGFATSVKEITTGRGTVFCCSERAVAAAVRAIADSTLVATFFTSRRDNDPYWFICRVTLFFTIKFGGIRCPVGIVVHRKFGQTTIAAKEFKRLNGNGIIRPTRMSSTL